MKTSVSVWKRRKRPCAPSAEVRWTLFVVSRPEGEQVFTLKGAEQPYRILVETMNEGAATLAADGTILYCNNRLSTMLRVPLERLMGTRFEYYVKPSDYPLLNAQLENCTHEGATVNITMLNESGTPFPVLISCFKHDSSGHQVISMVVTDLTLQVRTEEIIASEKLARSIIEQAGEAIVVCDIEGRIIRASRHAYRLCGGNPLLKQFDKSFQLLMIETNSLFSISKTLQGESFESIHVEFKGRRDEISHLILNATPLKSGQNQITGCVVTLTDITDHKLVEEALKDSEQMLRFHMENSPLAVIEWDKDFIVTRWTGEAQRIFGWSAVEMVGKRYRPA